jgi:hypothetical protein
MLVITDDGYADNFHNLILQNSAPSAIEFIIVWSFAVEDIISFPVNLWSNNKKPMTKQ